MVVSFGAALNGYQHAHHAVGEPFPLHWVRPGLPQLLPTLADLARALLPTLPAPSDHAVAWQTASVNFSVALTLSYTSTAAGACPVHARCQMCDFGPIHLYRAHVTHLANRVRRLYTCAIVLHTSRAAREFTDRVGVAILGIHEPLVNSPAAWGNGRLTGIRCPSAIDWQIDWDPMSQRH